MNLWVPKHKFLIKKSSSEETQTWTLIVVMGFFLGGGDGLRLFLWLCGLASILFAPLLGKENGEGLLHLVSSTDLKYYPVWIYFNDFWSQIKDTFMRAFEGPNWLHIGPSVQSWRSHTKKFSKILQASKEVVMEAEGVWSIYELALYMSLPIWLVSQSN